MRTTPTVITEEGGGHTVKIARGGSGRLVNTATSAAVFGQPLAGVQLPSTFHSTLLTTA